MATLSEVSTEREISQYEIERGKPMPTLIHGAIQANLIIQLGVKYANQYRVASEVTLNTKPDGSTPDLVLYPAAELDYKNDPSRRLDAPLLTIEIQSPSQTTKEMVAKLEPYFYFGVTSCWIVVPDFRAVLVYSDPFNYAFFHDAEIVRDSRLPIEVSLSKIFK